MNPLPINLTDNCAATQGQINETNSNVNELSLGVVNYNPGFQYVVGNIIRGDGVSGNLSTLYSCITNTTGTFNLADWQEINSGSAAELSATESLTLQPDQIPSSSVSSYLSSYTGMTTGIGGTDYVDVLALNTAETSASGRFNTLLATKTSDKRLYLSSQDTSDTEFTSVRPLAFADGDNLNGNYNFNSSIFNILNNNAMAISSNNIVINSPIFNFSNIKRPKVNSGSVGTPRSYELASMNDIYENTNNLLDSNNTWTGDNIFNGDIIYKDGDPLVTYPPQSISIVQSSFNSGLVENISYGKNKFVACVNSDGLYYSLDGITWTQSNITSGTIYSTNYDNNLWVASSDTGILYSLDGITWTQSNITSGYVYSSMYADDIWVAPHLTGVYYSLDGITWNDSTIDSGNYNSTYFADQTWVVTGDNGLYFSYDGITWTQSNITSGIFISTYYGNGKWQATTRSNLGIYYSLDGEIWTQSNITTGNFNVVYYSNDIWVAASRNTSGLYYSLDGITWTQSNITSGSFASISYDDGIFNAGSGGTSGIYQSLDGITWTQSNITSGSFASISFGNNTWVFGSNSGIYYALETYRTINTSLAYSTPQTFNSNILVPNQLSVDNSQKAANTAFVNTAISNYNTSILAAANTFAGSNTFTQNIIGNINSATNLKNGTSNQIPYQTAADTTSFISTVNNGTMMANSSGVPEFYVINGSYDAATNTPAINTMKNAQVWSVSTSGKVTGITISGATTSAGTTYLCAGDRVLFANGTYTLLNKEIAGNSENLTVGTGSIFTTLFDCNEYLNLRSYSAITVTLTSNTTETNFINVQNQCNGLLSIDGGRHTITVTANDGKANMMIFSAKNLTITNSFTIVGSSAATYNICSIINADINFNPSGAGSTLTVQNTATSTAYSLVIRDSRIIDGTSNIIANPDAPTVGFITALANTVTSNALFINNCQFNIFRMTVSGTTQVYNLTGFANFISTGAITSTWYGCLLNSAIQNTGTINLLNSQLNGGVVGNGVSAAVNITNSNVINGQTQASTLTLTGHCYIGFLSAITTLNAINQTSGYVNVRGNITTLTMGKNTTFSFLGGLTIGTMNLGQNCDLVYTIGLTAQTQTITTWNGGAGNSVRLYGISSGSFTLTIGSFITGCGEIYENNSNQNMVINVTGNYIGGNDNSFAKNRTNGVTLNLTGATSVFNGGANNSYQLDDLTFTTSRANNYKAGINNKFVFDASATFTNANFDVSSGWGTYVYYNGAARPTGEPASTFTYAHN